MKKNYALTLKFKGTAYCGWQVQKNALSIQTVVQDALERIFGSRLGVTGCSRTDSGVHANEYVCNIRNAPELNPAKIPLAVNTHLPADIAVTSAREVDDSFHARYSAKGKEYVYHIWNNRIHNPFLTETALHFSGRLNTDKAEAFTAGIVGRQDFASFMAAHSKIEDTVRGVWYFKVEREGDLISFIVAADGFLYNMARIMSGTLLQYMTGRITEPIESIIAAKDRNKAGITLPPHGLFLNKIFY
ncbi:MAG: tRNA pseudouridine(38-40) synthase TruA [Firmicutes bacterium HGW-Firmicutes-21]|nr:MAG: tRNA pseudouridine(38-40) synthase TruA [Firmicutes bacterium HGW-Firmicutes-21]